MFIISNTLVFIVFLSLSINLVENFKLGIYCFYFSKFFHELLHVFSEFSLSGVHKYLLPKSLHITWLYLHIHVFFLLTFFKFFKILNSIKLFVYILLNPFGPLISFIHRPLQLFIIMMITCLMLLVILFISYIYIIWAYMLLSSIFLIVI